MEGDFVSENIYKNMENKEIREFNLEIPQSRKIKIKNYKGSISIRGWEKDTVKINAIINTNEIVIGAKNFLTEEDINISVNSNDTDGITAVTQINKKEESKKSSSNHFIENLINWVGEKISNALSASVAYDVYIPSNINVFCETKFGNYIINDLKSDLVLSTGSGKIDIDNVEGNVNALTYNGRIMISSLNGNLNAETYNGKVILTDSKLNSASVKSMNGRLITHFTPIPSGEYNLKTMNGTIILGIPSDSSMKIHCKTMAGTVKNNIEADYDNSNSKRKMLIILGEGTDEGKMSVTTMSGDIYVMDYEEFDETDVSDMEDTEDFKRKFKISINLPKDSKEYQEAKEEITKAFNHINEDIKDLLFNTTKDVEIENTESDELQEIIEKFESIKNDFLNVVKEPNFNYKEDKAKFKEINDEYEERIKNLEKELHTKITKFNLKMKGVDEKFSEKLGAVTINIDSLSDRIHNLPKFIVNPIRHARRPGRPIGTGKKFHSSDEIKIILGMLKEGKITASEAEKLLKALK